MASLIFGIIKVVATVAGFIVAIAAILMWAFKGVLDSLIPDEEEDEE